MLTGRCQTHMGRITALIRSDKFYDDLAIEPISLATERVIVCGSMHMLKDVKELAERLGFKEGPVSHPGDFVVERASVGRPAERGSSACKAHSRQRRKPLL
jgi:ferredoxin--NADP+ reductase